MKNDAKTFKLIPGKYGNAAVTMGEGCIMHVTLYQTVVMRIDYNSHRVTLNTGNNRAESVQRTINTALDQLDGFRNVKVKTFKGEWFISINSVRFKELPFKDGMILGLAEDRATVIQVA